jgi:hypothetical protein
MRRVPHCMPRSFCEGSHEIFAGLQIKLIQQSIGCCILRIMLAWRLAFPAITYRVTYNPYCYYKGGFVSSLYVVVIVIFKLSGPLTHAAVLVLKIFIFALTRAQVDK